MAHINYALIKDGIVFNILVFDNPSDNMLESTKNHFEADQIVLSNNKSVIGGTYDGIKFWYPQPYPSWIKNEELNEWVAPIPYPTIEEGSDEKYTWDEPTTSWLLLPPSN